MSFGLIIRSALAALSVLATPAWAQPCLEKNLQYWQAFPPGGESDLSARHQQAVLRKSAALSKPLFSTRPVRVGL